MNIIGKVTKAGKESRRKKIPAITSYLSMYLIMLPNISDYFQMRDLGQNG
jgi:hypothetical protein